MTVNRYIFREILIPFTLGLAVFTFILLIARILKLVELVVNRGVPAWSIVKLFSLILPAFLEVTVPMALLLGILVAFGRLSSDSELVALKASGVSLYQLARPVAAFTVGIFLVTMTLSIYVRPWGNSLLRAALFDVAKTRASVGLRERVFNADFPGLVLYVDEIEPGGQTLHGVMISDTRDAKQHETAFARVGIITANEHAQTVTLRLLDGTIETTEPGKEAFHSTEFAIFDITLDLGAALSDLKPTEKDPKEMTLPELRQAIRTKAEAGQPSFLEQVELHRKFSIPFACFVFAAVGLPLGIQPARGVRARGFSVSLVLIFLYYIMLSLAESLGERGSVAPIVAMWTPNLIFGATGAYLFLLAARERRPAPLTAIEGWASALRTRIASRFTPAGP